MGKPNWAWVSCGMYSSRKSSVKRHIQNIHSGNANFVSFVDYLAGRKLETYWKSYKILTGEGEQFQYKEQSL